MPENYNFIGESGEESITENAPDLNYRDGEWSNSRRAIADEDQAFAVAERLFKDADELIRQTARIREKTDGVSPPFDPAKLKQEGKGHKSNMPTGFMDSIMGKVAPRLYSYVNNARYLDAAELPPQDPDSGVPIQNHQSKTEKLRKIFTRTVREWSKWYLFQVGLAEEDTRYGHCYVSWLDDTEWRPTLYRLDQGQVPTGTEILEEQIPLFAAKDTYLVHELFDKIRDREMAEEEGWEIDAVVEAINKAVPKPRATAGEEGQYIEYEDLIRECVPGWAYAKGARNVEVYHLFATEYDGRVSQYMVDKKTKKLLYKSEDRYAQMSDIVVPVTFQYGNGTIHGSYGVGHMVFDISNVVEKSRNGAMDSLRARTRMNLRVASAQDMNKAKLITHDAVNFIIGAEPVMNTGSLPDITESFISLDQYMRTITEEKIGAFLPPPQVPGLERTATEANLSAPREEETKRAILEYWLKHFGLITATMRRRLFSANSTDRLAQAAYHEALAEGITEREIEIWRNIPARASILDFSAQEDQQVAAYLQTKIGNPNYDQKKVERQITTSTIGSNYADDLIIPGEDDTVVAEAVRMQTLELLALENGEMVPVSPRDMDEIHMQVLMGQQDDAGQFGNGAIAALIAQGNREGAEAALDHWSQHVEQSKAKGSLGAMENDAKSFARQMSDALDMIGQSPEAQMQAPGGSPQPRPGTQDAMGGVRAPGVPGQAPAVDPAMI